MYPAPLLYKLKDMGKRLIILRHAKSSWKSGAPTDHQRPLNKRGRRDAPRIGACLNELGWIPDLVISSDSERTRETWQRMAEAFPESTRVRFTRDFYHGGLSAISNECASVDDDVSTLMVVGHNPGWEYTLSNFCGEYIRMTTANAALLESETDHWAQAVDSDWKFVGILRPKEL